jgi:hypothetical protein
MTTTHLDPMLAARKAAVASLASDLKAFFLDAYERGFASFEDNTLLHDELEEPIDRHLGPHHVYADRRAA